MTQKSIFSRIILLTLKLNAIRSDHNNLRIELTTTSGMRMLYDFCFLTVSVKESRLIDIIYNSRMDQQGYQVNELLKLLGLHYTVTYI